MSREGPFVECIVKRTDGYAAVVIRAAKATGTHGKHLQLFKVRGAVIKNEKLEVDGRKVSWTLGMYLRVRRVSAEDLKIGVGRDPISICSSSLVSMTNSNDVKVVPEYSSITTSLLHVCLAVSNTT